MVKTKTISRIPYHYTLNDANGCMRLTDRKGKSGIFDPKKKSFLYDFYNARKSKLDIMQIPKYNRYRRPFFFVIHDKTELRMYNGKNDRWLLIDNQNCRHFYKAEENKREIWVKREAD